VTTVAIVHDYLTQRGGAERVVLSMLKAFPQSPLYTSLYEPDLTFPEFAHADIRALPLNALRPLRKHHRLALALLGPAFSRCRITADVVLCSSSGWAHGVAVEGRKIVYCYSPARWLYQPTRYLGERGPAARSLLWALRPYLLRWDRRAAASADAYLTSSTAVAGHIRSTYGIEASIVAPPFSIDPSGEAQEVHGVDPGFFLCVSRLLPYKNLDGIIRAFAGLQERLIIVGSGPERRRLFQHIPSNVRLVGSVSEQQLRWLYAHAAGLIAASYEDYGLTPLEAAAFGLPACVLRGGGFLDTVIEGETGLFFDRPEPEAIRAAVLRMCPANFDKDRLRAHAARFSEVAFIDQLRCSVLGVASHEAR
jgi:glycosyltransferase involved in cell wall biosynthesis